VPAKAHPVTVCSRGAMLRYNLFTYRDLWTWIDQQFEPPPAHGEHAGATIAELDSILSKEEKEVT